MFLIIRVTVDLARPQAKDLSGCLSSVVKMASPQERRMVVILVRFHRFTQKLAKYWSLYITYVALGPLELHQTLLADLWKYGKEFTFTTIALQPPSFYQLLCLLEIQLFSLVRSFSVRKESVFCIVICWHWSAPKYQSDALQKPQMQQSNRKVEVGSFFYQGLLIQVESQARWHFDQQLLRNSVQSDFQIEEMNTQVLLRIQCHLEHLF